MTKQTRSHIWTHMRRQDDEGRDGAGQGDGSCAAATGQIQRRKLLTGNWPTHW